ncbi:MAG: hypothetical protein ACYS0I_13585 [Planctomycetota bacterium]|jgi:hypothetical protein
MDLLTEPLLRRFKRHIAIIGGVLGIVVLLALFTDIFRTTTADSISRIMWFLAGVILLVTVLIILAKVITMLGVLNQNDAKLEKIAEALEKNRSILNKIDQGTRLSEAAKTIAFRDADRQTLREAVFDKLQQHDFETTDEIIDEIAHHAGYKDLADQLRSQAEKYRKATDQQRLDQLIANIEKLLENYEWAKASLQIERLIRAYPGFEKPKALRQELLDKKQERKKILLTAWDDAVKRQETDRSLEILRELDLYLSPNEGLALQEAARDVFRTKLHNLGVQFSLAVSAKKWESALEIGRQIVQDFPNSRMAQEIRERWDALKQKVQPKS